MTLTLKFGILLKSFNFNNNFCIRRGRPFISHTPCDKTFSVKQFSPSYLDLEIWPTSTKLDCNFWTRIQRDIMCQFDVTRPFTPCSITLTQWPWNWPTFPALLKQDRTLIPDMQVYVTISFTSHPNLWGYDHDLWHTFFSWLCIHSYNWPMGSNRGPSVFDLWTVFV